MSQAIRTGHTSLLLHPIQSTGVASRGLQLALYAALALISCQTALAQSQEPVEQLGADEKRTKSTARREARLQAMQKIAAEMTVEVVEGDFNRKVHMIEGARFRFSTQDTLCYDGTVWIWGRGGRAVALLTISAERGELKGPSNWAFELTSLSPQKLTVSSQDGWSWTPQAAGLKYAAVPDAPPPADLERTRLRQMKDIARRFNANGVADGRRFELRVLPTPIHRYSDEQAGIVDGALFFIADGTNPEVLLAIEAMAREDARPQWTYAINRVSAAELHARLDGKEIWTAPRVVKASIRSPYYLFPRPMPKQLGDE